MVDRDVGQRIFHRVTVAGQCQQRVGMGYHMSLSVKDAHGKGCLPLRAIVRDGGPDVYLAVVCRRDLQRMSVEKQLPVGDNELHVAEETAASIPS